MGGQVVAAGLIDAGVSEQLDDDDEVVALAYEAGSEGMPQDVWGELVDVRVVGDGPEYLGGGSGGEPPAAAV